MVSTPIYMDSHATTRTDPRVVEAMLPYFSEHYGNAASRTHAFGWTAADAIDTARRQIATLIGARSSEIVFTSGATEANNLAIKGVVEPRRHERRHIITVVIEHRAVLDACRRVEQHGCRVTYLPVRSDGLVDLDELTRAITPETVLITVMTANNEIGVMQPIAEIGAIAKAHGVLCHSDAAQAAGKTPLDVKALDVDLLSLSAHKMYGPKGIGALYVRRRDPRVQLSPMMDGGGHERGLRSGTLNVTGAVGFGAAAQLCAQELDADDEHTRRLRDRLWDGLQRELTDLRLNGSADRRLPNNLNVSFAHVDGEALLMGLDDIAVSSGSACTTTTREPSYVIKALGAGDQMARASIRFGLSRYNSDEEVDYVVAKVAATVRHLRELSPLCDGALTEADTDPAVARWLSDA